MSDITLQFPSGQFTHSELAIHNKRTNQQVWTQYQAAIKTNTIVFVGLRTGKGKPSKLFQVAGPGVVAATEPTKVIQTVAAVIPTPKPVKPAKPIVPTVTPTETLSATDTNVLVAVAAVTSEPEEVELEDVTVSEEELPIAREVEPNVRTPENMSCPICGKDCIAWDDATGVMVQCNQPIEVCSCCENPYGHGRNEKVAYEVLCQKYGNRK